MEIEFLALMLTLSDEMPVIKAKIHEETGMPPGKQKLQWEVRMCITSEISVFVISLLMILVSKCVFFYSECLQ